MAIRSDKRDINMMNTLETSWTMKIPEEKKGLDAGMLKIIAVISMVIDHTGCMLVGRYMNSLGASVASAAGREALLGWRLEYKNLVIFYNLLRDIGRIAFPIYCFFLVEGLIRTRDRKKYALRLLLFGVISEIPFDLALSGNLVYLDHQNVFFELFAGLLTIICLEEIEKRINSRIFKAVLTMGTVVAAFVITEFTKLDYSGLGILCIVVLYLLRGSKIRHLVAGAIVFAWEFPASLAFAILATYNGKRGKGLKYLFYLIYPVHLLLLYIISVVLGLGAYTAW